MKLAYEPRASAVLYNLLKSRTDKRPFLLPANICPIVPITFLKASVDFSFIDISPTTLNMNEKVALEHLRTGNFSGILYAHTYGENSTPTAFFAEAKSTDPSILVIDDRCLCPPDEKMTETMEADVTLYSTGYAKMADLGFGGYAFVQDSISYTHQRLLYEPGAYKMVEETYKKSLYTGEPYVYSNCNWLETDRNLPPWEEYISMAMDEYQKSSRHRQQINEVYESTLPQAFYLSGRFQSWRFNLLIPNKKRILNAIFAEELFASSYYASLAGIFAPGVCPQAEKLHAGIINLFNDRNYTIEKAERTCSIILKNL